MIIPVRCFSCGKVSETLAIRSILVLIMSLGRRRPVGAILAAAR